MSNHCRRICTYLHSTVQLVYLRNECAFNEVSNNEKHSKKSVNSRLMAGQNKKYDVPKFSDLSGLNTSL